jgi:transposase-like protein
MANIKETEKERARELYFNTSWKQCRIAREVGVSEKTISTWVIEGNWKAIKKTAYHSSTVEVQRLYDELRVISVNISKRKPEERFPTKEELDARTRILALINAWDNLKDNWRNIHDDHELSIPSDFNTTPTETKTPQTSIPQ